MRSYCSYIYFQFNVKSIMQIFQFQTVSNFKHNRSNVTSIIRSQVSFPVADGAIADIQYDRQNERGARFQKI